MKSRLPGDGTHTLSLPWTAGVFVGVLPCGMSVLGLLAMPVSCASLISWHARGGNAIRGRRFLRFGIDILSVQLKKILERYWSYAMSWCSTFRQDRPNLRPGHMHCNPQVVSNNADDPRLMSLQPVTILTKGPIGMLTSFSP